MKSLSTLSSIALSCFLSSSLVDGNTKETGFKCYGVAGPSENDCAALDNHDYSCSGQSRRDHHIGDWKVMESKSKCKSAGGFTENEARQRLGLPIH